MATNLGFGGLFPFLLLKKKSHKEKLIVFQQLKKAIKKN
jgi:hypothetical protein